MVNYKLNIFSKAFIFRGITKIYISFENLNFEIKVDGYSFKLILLYFALLS